MFSETMYSIDEEGGPAQIELVLSNASSSSDIIVEVLNTDGSATGEYCSIMISYEYYNGMTNTL